MCGNVDVCPTVFDAFQTDTDGDGIGDPCEVQRGIAADATKLGCATASSCFYLRVRSGELVRRQLNNVSSGSGLLSSAIKWRLVASAPPVANSVAGDVVVRLQDCTTSTVAAVYATEMLAFQAPVRPSDYAMLVDAVGTLDNMSIVLRSAYYVGIDPTNVAVRHDAYAPRPSDGFLMIVEEGLRHPMQVCCVDDPDVARRIDDVDECRLRTHSCVLPQQCFNTFGSFTCGVPGQITTTSSPTITCNSSQYEVRWLIIAFLARPLISSFSFLGCGADGKHESCLSGTDRVYCFTV